jgi:hypothetical protein
MRCARQARSSRPSTSSRAPAPARPSWPPRPRRVPAPPQGACAREPSALPNLRGSACTAAPWVAGPRGRARAARERNRAVAHAADGYHAGALPGRVRPVPERVRTQDWRAPHRPRCRSPPPRGARPWPAAPRVHLAEDTLRHQAGAPFFRRRLTRAAGAGCRCGDVGDRCVLHQELDLVQAAAVPLPHAVGALGRRLPLRR